MVSTVSTGMALLHWPTQQRTTPVFKTALVSSACRKYSCAQTESGGRGSPRTLRSEGDEGPRHVSTALSLETPPVPEQKTLFGHGRVLTGDKHRLSECPRLFGGPPPVRPSARQDA